MVGKALFSTEVPQPGATYIRISCLMADPLIEAPLTLLIPASIKCGVGREGSSTDFSNCDGFQVSDDFRYDVARHVE